MDVPRRAATHESGACGPRMDFPRALAILATPGVTHAHPGAPDPRVDAERTVQTYVDSPSCVPSLVSALVSDGLASAATRHLAAVLLSAAADRHWSALGDDVKAATRSGTLAALSRTDDRAELRALVHAADVVARHSATDGSPWSELLPALRDAAKSTHATHREAAMLLLGSLVESMGAHMNDHHAALVALFAAALRDDPSDAVAVSAARALGNTALALQRRGDFLIVADLIPRVLAACVDAAARRLEAGDDEGVAACIDAIASAAAVESDAVFGADLALLPAVVDVAMRVGTDARLDPDGRARAVAFDALGSLAASHAGLLDEPRPAKPPAGSSSSPSPGATSMTTFADGIMPGLCAAAATGLNFTDAGRAEGEAESNGWAAAARSTLRRFSLHLPPATILPHVVAPLDAATAAGTPPTPGALACLAAVTEGCASDLAEDPIASNVVGSIASGLNSADPAAKVAAALAFKELAEHAGHALTELFSDLVIPALVTAVVNAVEYETEAGDTDAAESFVAPAHAAAAHLCDEFGGDDIEPALRDVIPPLLGGALGGWRRGDGVDGAGRGGVAAAPRMTPRARARCLDTLERFARAAAWEFAPFAVDVLAAMTTLAAEADLSSSSSVGGGVGEGASAVRSRALAAMATVICAVGEEAAAPGVVDGALDASTRILSDPAADSVARECALRCFGRLATVLERRLAPWLGGVIAAAAASLAAADAAGGFARDGKSSRAVSAGDASESIAAAEALGSLVNSCGSSTRPHLGVALAALGRAATSPSSPAALRVAAARAVEFSLKPLEADGDGGGGGGGEPAVPTDAAAPVAAEAVALLARLVTGDEEPEVALAAATSLEEVARVGAQFFGVGVDSARAAAAAVLDGSARCQEGAADGADGGDGEDGGTVFFDLEDQARRLRKSLA